MLAEGGVLGGLAALLGAGLLMWFFMNLLGALLVGAIARFVIPGKEKVGWFTTIAVGFLGGLVANVVGKLAGWVPAGKNVGLLGSILGAIVLLLAYRLWSAAKAGKTAPPRGIA